MQETHVMTDEVRQELLGFAPFHKDATFDFTPDFYLNKKPNPNWEKGKDKPEDELIHVLPKEVRAVFKVRALTPKEDLDNRAYLKKGLKDPETIDPVRDSEPKELSRKVTMGWETLYDAGTMELIPFEKDEKGNPTPGVWERISPSLRMAILFRAVKLSGISAREKLGLGS